MLLEFLEEGDFGRYSQYSETFEPNPGSSSSFAGYFFRVILPVTVSVYLIKGCVERHRAKDQALAEHSKLEMIEDEETR